MQRDVLTIRVRNAHSAPVAKVPPKGEGLVDANNPGVRVALKAGLLVPVEGDGAEGEAPKDAVVNPADHLAALDEIKRLRVALDHERDSAAAHIADLERELTESRAQVEQLTAPKAKKGS